MKMVKMFPVFLLWSVLLLACSRNAQIPPGNPVIQPAITAEQKAPGKSAWDRLITEAKKERRLSFWSVADGAFKAPVVNAMREKFGIELDFITGRGNELQAKLLTQRKAGIYDIDVYMGGKSMAVDLKPQGVLDPLPPHLFLPEVLDPKVWWDGKLTYIDSDKQILAVVANPSSALAVNSNIIGKGEVTSYLDLLNPKWKGKMVLNDPGTPGVSQEWFAVVSSRIMSLDYMKQLAQTGLIVIRDQRLQAEWLSHGKYPIAIAPQQSTVTQFIKDGAPLELITPKEGVNLTSSSGNLAIMKNAPHPSAAKLFLNWFLTREGQTLFSQTTGFQSARVDVPTAHLAEFSIRKPGVKYFSTSDEEFARMIADYTIKAREIFWPLMQ